MFGHWIICAFLSLSRSPLLPLCREAIGDGADEPGFDYAKWFRLIAEAARVKRSDWLLESAKK